MMLRNGMGVVGDEKEKIGSDARDGGGDDGYGRET